MQRLSLLSPATRNEIPKPLGGDRRGTLIAYQLRCLFAYSVPIECAGEIQEMRTMGPGQTTQLTVHLSDQHFVDPVRIRV